jgi:hypothetical protein
MPDPLQLIMPRLLTERRVEAITLACSEIQHHNALSKPVRTRVHGFSTSAYTWDL